MALDDLTNNLRARNEASLRQQQMGAMQPQDVFLSDLFFRPQQDRVQQRPDATPAPAPTPTIPQVGPTPEVQQQAGDLLGFLLGEGAQQPGFFSGLSQSVGGPGLNVGTPWAIGNPFATNQRQMLLDQVMAALQPQLQPDIMSLLAPLFQQESLQAPDPRRGGTPRPQSTQPNSEAIGQVVLGLMGLLGR